MKNLKSALVIIAACLYLSTQVSAQDKKVTLVTFFSVKKISGTGLGVAAESLVSDTNFNLKPSVQKAYIQFITEFAKDFPFKLDDKGVTASNAEYQNYHSKMFWDTAKAANKALNYQFVSADGLILALPGGALVKAEDRDECNLAKIFSGSDGIMFVQIDYEIESRMMGVAAGITANIDIALYDKKCEKIFRIRESGKSSKKVAAVAGIPVMKPEKIQPLCEDATEQLFNELNGKLGKIIKKSGKL
jgi:hypothetical protein